MTATIEMSSANWEESYVAPERSTGVQVFSGAYDEEGVYFYQAFNAKIADYAVEHQCFGGPEYKRNRMTWIKPSFAWMLYRCGYGRKENQERVLKVKLSHRAVAEILSMCTLTLTHGAAPTKEALAGSHTNRPGRIQWDPARDLMDSANGEPRRIARERAIQIGLKRASARLYIESVLSVEDVTDLAHRVGHAHSAKGKGAVKRAMQELLPELPVERNYLPACRPDDLRRLAMLPR